MGNLSEFKDFIPNSKEVLVGTSKIMVVDELSIIKKDQIMRILLETLDVASLLKPFFELMDDYRARKEKAVKDAIKAEAAGEQDEVDEEVKKAIKEFSKSVLTDFLPMAGQIKDICLKFLSNDMTAVSCIVLDTEANRKIAELESDKLEKNKESGFEYCPDMFSYVQKYLTPKQEQQMFKMFLEVNDFAGLVKNYWTLVAGQMNAAREEKSAKENQPVLQ